LAIAWQPHILWRVLATRLQTVKLFQELKRRNVFRVGIAYVVAAWVLLQVFDVIGEILDLPAWGGKLILAMLLVGFVIALIVAWAYELTPEGVKRESELDRSQLPEARTGRGLNALIIGLLLVAVSYLLFDKFFLQSRLHEGVEDSTAGSAQSVSAPEMPGTSGISSQSIAVLPFVNMSANAENEYFSDGLTETLLHLLAQVPDLKVAARTSSFAFKGTQTDIREIAAKLDVAHILEGSVQRAGERVRITAQLIQASDGYHLWSRTFDRDLDNIFAVQDEIAAEVTTALTGSILPDTMDAARRDGGTSDTEAYDLYLRGREALHANTARKVVEAERLMRRAVARDPDFALAWAGLAEALDRDAVLGGRTWVDYRDEYRAAAEKAFELAPENPQVLSVLGEVRRGFREMGEAQELLERAIELDPSNAEAWSRLADVYFGQGKFRDAAGAATRAMTIDPLDFDLKGQSTFKFLQLGEVEKAEMLARAILKNDPNATSGLSALGNIYWRTGRYADAYRVYYRMREINPDTIYVLDRLARSFIELGDRETASEILDAIESSNPDWIGARTWLCHIEGKRECARSILGKRAEMATTEEEQVRSRTTLARLEENWSEALKGSLALVELAVERNDSMGAVWNRQWAALAAGRLGNEALRAELVQESMEYWNDGIAQGSDSQYIYAFRAMGFAIIGDSENAISDLERAIQRGYRGEPDILHDGFYDDILDEPRLQEVLTRLRASNAEELARLRAVINELGSAW
jgi:TolB-like protein/tetratricopeptide (TPR) repeat protein